MKRLLFSRVDVEIFEDIDFSEDPAPYVRIFTHDPEFLLELEEWRRYHEVSALHAPGFSPDQSATLRASSILP